MFHAEPITGHKPVHTWVNPRLPVVTHTHTCQNQYPFSRVRVDPGAGAGQLKKPTG